MAVLSMGVPSRSSRLAKGKHLRRRLVLSNGRSPGRMKPLLIFIALQATTLLIGSSEAAPLVDPGCGCRTCFGCCGVCCCQQFSSSTEDYGTDETETVETRSPFIPALVVGAVEAAEVIGPAIVAGAEALVDFIGPALATVGRFAVNAVNAVKNVPPQMWDNMGTALGVAADAAEVVYEKP